MDSLQCTSESNNVHRFLNPVYIIYLFICIILIINTVVWIGLSVNYTLLGIFLVPFIIAYCAKYFRRWIPKKKKTQSKENHDDNDNEIPYRHKFYWNYDLPDKYSFNLDFERQKYISEIESCMNPTLRYYMFSKDDEDIITTEDNVANTNTTIAVKKQN